MFVFQWLYDSAQILADNKELEKNPERMLEEKYVSYVMNLGKRMISSLDDTDEKQ